MPQGRVARFVPAPVHYIPVLTTVVAIVFTGVVLQRWRAKGRGAHLLWWAAGLAFYGLGTFTEAYTTLFGWNEPVFRTWYVAGALLGAMPLAQGTVYLLLKRRDANVLTAIVVPFAAIAAMFVLLSPIDATRVEEHRLSGQVLAWSWVRLFSPFLNTYALVFLVGGAALSAWRFRKKESTRNRMVGNVLIAVGGLLPGIGGAFTRFGYVEVLYVTEILGLALIFAGYRFNVREPTARDASDGRSALAATR